MTEPFVAVARAKGVGRARVLVRHQLRNALVPLITLLGLSLPMVIVFLFFQRQFVQGLSSGATKG